MRELLIPELGLHHFAYLRATAEGLPQIDSGKRYLAIEHGAEIVTVNRMVVERARAHVRRLKDPRWRLIGLNLQERRLQAAQSGQPSLDQWAESEGLEDWPENELLSLYAERFPPIDEASGRRQQRNERLRLTRIDLLRKLEETARAAASEAHPLSGWLPPHLAQQLAASGMHTLGDLVTRMRQGGRWYHAISGFGKLKSQALENFVQGLLGPNALKNEQSWQLQLDHDVNSLAGRTGVNRLPVLPGGIEANDDRHAIEAWLAARATSPETRRSFLREVERFLLFCIVERNVAMSAASTDDCAAYMRFLEAVPDRWIARGKCKRFAPGWAPFKGQLTTTSRQQALTIVSALFKWLVDGHYIARNPWHLVNRHLGQGREVMTRTASRAIPPVAWDAMLAYLDEQEPTLSNERLRWVCVFVRVTGLRADELVNAKIGDLLEIDGSCFLQVYGKRRKQRFVPVPTVGQQALARYLACRGLTMTDTTDSTPLLASLDDNNVGVTTRGLAHTFTRFLRRMLKHSTLSEKEQLQTRRISLHWLRHTYATVAVERGMPPDVLQANLGQESPITTARYYRAQEKRRGTVTEGVFSVI